MSDKFDFKVAEMLIQTVERAASTLDVKNGQMEKRFGDLREHFKDSGYDDFAVDMKAANESVKEIIDQLHMISQKLGDYAERIRKAE